MTMSTSPALRASHYLAVSPAVGRRAFRMVYSTRSARSLLMSDADWADVQHGRIDQLPSALKTALVEHKILVPAHEDERALVVAHNKASIKSDDMLYLGIAPSANCQLGCDYCGQKHENRRMDDPIMQGVLKRAEHKLAQRGGYKRLQIGWFGAEPLLGIASIRTLTPRLQALAAEHRLAYSAQMATNGVALTPKLFFELVEQHRVMAFDITLDGAREFHDQRRVTKDGRPSFDTILNNLKGIAADPRFASCGAWISIRCNVDGRNHDGTIALVETLREQDLLRHFRFYTAPVHSWGNDAHLESLSQQRYADFEVDLLGRLIDAGQSPSLVPKALKPIVCMSVREEAELIDPYGEAFNCTEVSQVPAYQEVRFYRLDDVRKPAISPPKARPFSDWNDRILAGEVPCHSCRILPICGGKCPKHWTEGISPCPSIKHNIEARLTLEMVRLNRQGRLVNRSQ
jgi:uncharacterized protein